MEKLKKCINEIVYFVVFIAFISFCFLNFLEFEIGETTYYLNVYQLMSGYSSQDFTISSNYIVIFFYVLVSISVILVAIRGVFKIFDKNIKTLDYFTLVFLILSFILILLTSTITSNFSNVKELNASVDNHDVGVIMLLICILLMSLETLRSVFEGTKYTTHDVVEISCLIALAIVFDKFASIKIGQTGGSFNFSGIPLLIICLRHGPLKGLISCSLVFGFLTCVLDGYGLHTYPFDYLIAFSGYALCGLAYYLFDKYFIKPEKDNSQTRALISIAISYLAGAIGVMITRMIGSTISSMIYYGYELYPALAYNALYVCPSAAVCFGCCILLLYPTYTINKQFPINK